MKYGETHAEETPLLLMLKNMTTQDPNSKAVMMLLTMYKSKFLTMTPRCSIHITMRAVIVNLIFFYLNIITIKKFRPLVGHASNLSPLTLDLTLKFTDKR